MAERVTALLSAELMDGDDWCHEVVWEATGEVTDWGYDASWDEPGAGPEGHLLTLRVVEPAWMATEPRPAASFPADVLDWAHERWIEEAGRQGPSAPDPDELMEARRERAWEER